MTLKLYDLSLHRLHHPEFTQLLHRTVEDFKAANLRAKDEDFTRLLNSLKTQLPTLQTALEQVKSSEKSQPIQELDLIRDRALRALMDSVKPYRYSSVPNEKQAYTALSLLFKQFKDVAKRNFEEESSLIANLLGKLASAEYSDDVTALGLSKFITALTNAQAAFETAFTARSKESIGKVSYNVKALRQQASDDYRLLCDYVYALARVKQDTFYPQALTILNNSRKYFSDTIAKRKTTKKDKQAPITA
ncbi:DUF6261 family protein [Aerococcaceae bacterium NML210727]|nr:DUF6261 family protein [Aerococcaceae bacterium NML210727]MCW6654470.1 DUF6261 family protein [Aerococcaceae bacterium NML201296]